MESAGPLKERSNSSRRSCGSSTLYGRLLVSTSSSKTRPKRHMTRLTKKACLIQAAFRGFLGRKQAQEMALKKRLAEIQSSKQQELASIETKKQEEKCSLDAAFKRSSLTGQETAWQSQSQFMTQLTSKVQTIRAENAHLKQQVVALKNENKVLALENSNSLVRCKEAELRSNKLESSRIHLLWIARTYREALYTGRQMLLNLDEEDGFDEQSMTSKDPRLCEIRQMMKLAEEEDELL